jgi:hypothetical protein
MKMEALKTNPSRAFRWRFQLERRGKIAPQKIIFEKFLQSLVE